MSLTTPRRELQSLRRGCWAFALALTLAGCTTPPPATPAPAVQPLAQYMQEASQATGEGSKQRSRDLYYTAAKNYPTSKEPWLKLAEDYFEAANYGQAILAAQEVVQRDPADSLAAGVLAVSGLRVSAAALSTLREQQTTLNGGTRSEAEGLARTLRELLGEPVLVPRPATPAPTTPAPARPRAPRPSAATAPGAASAPAKPTSADNPFNVLKK
jgi:hypothetical protein